MTNLKHNNRTLKKEDYLKEAHKHIIQDLSNQNLYIVQEDLKSAYEIFEPFVKKYNLKQTRNDRKISNYYNHVKKSKTLDLQREFIITIGKKEDYDKLEPKAKTIMANFLKNYVEDFIKRNRPHFYTYNAVIHVDEIGAPHAHINIIPLATGYKKGLYVQPSFRKALDNLGFKTNGRKQLSEFRNHEINIIENKLREFNIERKKVGTTDIKNIKEYKKIMKEIDKTKEELSNFENLSKIKRSETFQLENDIDILKREKNILEGQIKASQDKLKLIQEKINNYDNDIFEINEDINTMIEFFNNFKNEIETYKFNIPDINSDLQFIKHLGYQDIASIIVLNQKLITENKAYKSLFSDMKDIISNFNLINAFDKVKQIATLIKNFVLPTLPKNTRDDYYIARNSYISKINGYNNPLQEKIAKIKKENEQIAYKISNLEKNISDEPKLKR